MRADFEHGPAAGLVVPFAAILIAVAPAAGDASEPFAAGDLATLWPVPATVADADALISADAALDDGGSLWPRADFDRALELAAGVRIPSPSPLRDFAVIDLPDAFRDPHVWKVVAFRVDGSAPGGHADVVALFGSDPQLRVTLQPVTVRDEDEKVEVHDVAAHLVFHFVAPAEPGADGGSRPTADRAAFEAVLADVRAARDAARAAGADTAGPLGVHPGFSTPDPAAFRDRLADLLRKHPAAARLRAVSLMGIEDPEPWLFFAAARRPGSPLQLSAVPSLAPETAQMLTMRGFPKGRVVPEPSNRQFGDRGVSTAPLFDLVPGSPRLADPALPGDADEAEVPTLADVPDVIANPRLSHFFNTDCVSCHSETARRRGLGLADRPAGPFTFTPPAGDPGPDPALLPTDRWNTRMFGWFPRGGRVAATVTRRTANEAAEAAEFVNANFPPPGP